jgi:hypothetical protein
MVRNGLSNGYGQSELQGLVRLRPKAAVSFNMVVKTGVGHGVAPATISISRYN